MVTLKRGNWEPATTVTHKSVPRNPTIERAVLSPFERIHRRRQWKSFIGLDSLGCCTLLYSPGSWGGAGQSVPVPVLLWASPLLCFTSVAQPCERDLIARIIIRREWQGRNLITVNPRLVVPPCTVSLAQFALDAES